MKKDVLTVLLVAVILVIGAAVITFLTGGRPNNSTVTAPTFPGYQAIATDSNSTIGIDLSLALNSTTIRQGQDIQDVVQVLNTLPRVNNISVGSDFLVKPLDAKCLPGDYTPIVAQMYSGSYDRASISSASPLTYILSCPSVGNNSLTKEYYYLFEPNSANATLYGRTYAGDLGNSGAMSLRLVNQISIHEFSFSFPKGTFPNGLYTLMVEDWWGQIVILQFSIVS